LELIAWYCGNSGDRVHAGGGLQPNGFGLSDMIGNLGEWNNAAGECQGCCRLIRHAA
jgi:formylglycine-generating enzyme required for sulfatase activity